MGAVRLEFLPERHEVAPRNDLAHRVHDHARASQLIGDRPTGRRVRGRRGGGVLRDEFTAGIDEDGGLGSGLFLYPLALAVVAVAADDVVLGVLDLRLLVVPVEGELPPVRVDDEVPVLVEGEARRYSVCGIVDRCLVNPVGT
jgi:hypothetical protein